MGDDHPEPGIAEAFAKELARPGVREIRTVSIAGVDVDASKVVCPECGELDLDTDFETSQVPWVATCTKGHVWGVTP